jgi:hypothetical protein
MKYMYVALFALTLCGAVQAMDPKDALTPGDIAAIQQGMTEIKKFTANTMNQIYKKYEPELQKIIQEQKALQKKVEEELEPVMSNGLETRIAPLVPALKRTLNSLTCLDEIADLNEQIHKKNNGQYIVSKECGICVNALNMARRYHELTAKDKELATILKQYSHISEFDLVPEYEDEEAK